MTEQTKTQQVRIQVLGTDGEWFTPHQVPSVLAALPAIGEDIEQYSGSYSTGDLVRIREALTKLTDLVSRRIPGTD